MTLPSLDQIMDFCCTQNVIFSRLRKFCVTGLTHCSRVRGADISERANGRDDPKIEMSEYSRHSRECSHFNQRRVITMSLFICLSHKETVC